MFKKLVVSLVSIIIVGCASDTPVYKSPSKPAPAGGSAPRRESSNPPCDYTVSGKCRTFTADDKQGSTTYGHGDESQ